MVVLKLTLDITGKCHAHSTFLRNVIGCGPLFFTALKSGRYEKKCLENLTLKF